MTKKLKKMCKKLGVMMVMLSTLGTVQVNAALPEQFFDTKTYEVSASDTDVKIIVEDSKIKLTATDLEGVSLWFRLVQNNEIVVDEVEAIKKGQVEVDLPLIKLDKDEVAMIEVYIKHDKNDQTYWSHIWGEQAVLNYSHDQWQFKLPPTPILEQNYKMFYGTEPVEVRQIQEGIILAKSNEICEGIESDYEKVKAIDDWVANNIYYDYNYYYDSTQPIVYDSVGVLETRASVCEGYANLFQDLVLAQGIPCIKVSGLALGISMDGYWKEEDLIGNETNHAWNEVYIEDENRWIIVDTTWNSRNTFQNGEYTKKESNNRYFDISLATFSVDHKIINSPKYVEEVLEVPSF